MNLSTTTRNLSICGFFQGPMRPEDELTQQFTNMYRRLQTGFLYHGLKLRRTIKHHINYLLKGESGIGTIELVLILVVLIALVIVFKGRINDLLTSIFDQIDSSAQSVY
ncbi:Flp1 family type IVb pilin [Oribacterium sp. WCC10]|uniref:Flp1 family type IVb pilin n=1 Tax=Oribacterium sp. WCC10 TaxID=1855343 RepID=UPI0008EC6C6B|nr:Flp1 family type IVb pilin [Oribacterium sp. WCC10]SFG34026.1 Putative Flagellin, Flp1-like, domain [Oribacterium sp. WCC10]